MKNYLKWLSAPVDFGKSFSKLIGVCIIYVWRLYRPKSYVVLFMRICCVVVIAVAVLVTGFFATRGANSQAFEKLTQITEESDDFEEYVFGMEWTPEYCYINRGNPEIVKLCRNAFSKNTDLMMFMPEGLFIIDSGHKYIFSSQSAGNYKHDCRISNKHNYLQPETRQRIKNMYEIAPHFPTELWKKYGKCTNKDMDDFFTAIWFMYRRFRLFGRTLVSPENFFLTYKELKSVFGEYADNVSFECNVEVGDVNEEYYYLHKVLFGFDKHYNKAIPISRKNNCKHADYIILRGFNSALLDSPMVMS